MPDINKILKDKLEELGVGEYGFANVVNTKDYLYTNLPFACN